MPSLLLAPPKMLRNTGLELLAKQKIDTPVRRGKIPVRRRRLALAECPRGAGRGILTLRNDLPEEHDEEDSPEEADTLRSHLIIIMQRLEQVDRKSVV